VTKLRSLTSGGRLPLIEITRIVSVVLLCGVAVVPLLRGVSPCTHDGGLHYYRVVAIRHTLGKGLFFTRWLPDFAFGYGFPFFNYRAPLSYYLGVGFHLVGLSLPLALNLVYVSSILGSAMGAYLFSRDLFGSRAGMVAAVAYAYAPYQFLNALVRGNAPESVALALLPFILWAFRRLALRGDRWWFLVSVGLLAGLYLTHNISSLLFTPFLLAYLVVLWWVHRERGEWKLVTLALVLALGLTAFFWFPALAEKGYVQLYLTGATRNNDFHYNFLTFFEVFAPPETVDMSLINPPLKVKLGLAQTGLAVAGLVAGLAFFTNRGGRAREKRVRAGARSTRCRGAKEKRVTLLFFAASASLFIFMSTSASVWIWEHVPLLPFVQFPWRFVGRASLPVALLAGAVVPSVTKQETDRTSDGGGLRRDALRLLPVVLVSGIILSALPATYPPTGYCPMKPFPTIQDVHRYERDSGLVGVDPVGAYFPTWVQQRPQESPLEAQYGSEGPVSRFDASVLPDEAHILEADYGPNRARIVVESPESFQARYLSFHFPGWRAYVDGERVKITPSDPLGLITFNILPGRHEVTVRFGETPLRLTVDLLSTLCLVILVLFLSWPLRRRLTPEKISCRKLIFRGIGVTTLLFLLALACDVTPYLRGPNEWRWNLAIPGYPQRYIIPAVALVMYVGITVFWGERNARAGDPSPLVERGFLIFLVMSVPIIQVCLLATEGPDVLEPLFYRTVSPTSSGVFSVASTIDNAVEFLRHYPERMPSFPVHPQRYPPGLPLVFHAARRVLEQVPQLSDCIAHSLRLRQCHNLTLMRLPNTTIASATVQMALPLVCGLVVLPIYGLARRAAGRRVAVWAAALYPLVPSFNLWFARWDAFYALLSAVVWYLFYVGLDERRRLPLLAAGVVLSLGSFLSFGILALLLPIGCWIILRLVTRRQESAFSWLVSGAFTVGVGLITPWLLYQVAFGHGFLDIWRVSMSYHLGLDRNYWTWLGYHLYDFLVFLGLPLALLLVLSSFTTLRNLDRGSTLLPLGFVTGLVLLDVSGVARGEVARVWLFLTPFAVIGAAHGLSRLHPGRWGFAFVALLLGVQLLTFNAFLRVVTTGLEDPPDHHRIFTPPSIRFPLDVSLGERVKLLGYDIGEEPPQPGDTLNLSLYWQATAPLSRTYTVFTHLVGPEGQIVGQQDNMPVADSWPTTCWMPGEIVVDQYDIPVDSETSPGAYTLETGMYLLESGERLSTHGRSTTADGRVVLTEILVEGR